MSNRLYYMKVFFLQHKAYFVTAFVVFVLGFSSALIFSGSKIPTTEADYAEAMKTGAKLYEHGKHAEAFDKLIYPAQHGYPQARYMLGMLYYNGWGVEKDLKLAFENFYSAAENMIEAKYMTAQMAFRGETESLPKGTATTLLTETAYHGYTAAQKDLGVYSLMSKDYEQAYFWLSLAAQGDSSPLIRDALGEAASFLSDYQKGLLDTEIKGFSARK